MKRLITTAFIAFTLLAGPAMAQMPGHDQPRHEENKDHRSGHKAAHRHDRKEHHKGHRNDHKERRHDEHHE